MTTSDKNTFYDNKTNKANIFAGLTFNKCDPLFVKSLFCERMAGQWQRCRSKLIKVADAYYFKEMTPEELKQQLEEHVKIRRDIKTMAQVEDLMGQEQNTYIDTDGLQWRLWIFPEFPGDELVVIMKVHHVIADGLGHQIVMTMLQDDYDPKMMI
jgi:hypothetical protein